MNTIPEYVGYFYYTGITLTFLTPITLAVIYFERGETK